ncbi:phage portal protein [Paenibacillus polymyxa]|uniref:phage portal protein n=1 Tax=Paenibacillus polymyxa TaxID=1406 RepID=UPI0025B72445|nr:phage portal protein [Paenibacillus polymyxa]MDN4085957.1 phage portal protein [Paenibacillus polymyxa]MDN4111859.1 phage portal protein [Paenibacillus polymyxa]
MTTTEEVIYNLEKNAPMTNREIAQQEVNDFKHSKKLEWMIVGDLYYRNKTEILQHKRYVIGEGGAKIEAQNLANNKLVFGFVRKLVDQKTGYLLSKPISITTDGPKEYKDELDKYYGKSFLRQLKNLGKNAVNNGIGWLQIYYSETGELSFKVIPTKECVPLWKDGAHTELDAMIRFYPVEVYEAKTKKTIQIIEFWDSNGVMKWVQNSTSDYVPYEELQGHFSAEDVNGNVQQLNWERIPFIPFKYNDEEMPLVEILKTLVDDYDKHVSFNSNNLEDLPNDIIVLKNYDGTDLGEARRNLAQYRMTKVSGDGGIDTISVNIDTTALTSHITELRKSIYEFGRGVDTQSDKFGNSPSGIALRFLYGDLDMDANIIETEFQASLEQLLWFVNQHLANTTNKDYSEFDVEFIFNRDILINETEAVTNAKDSVGVISDETIVANHPFVTNVQDELDRIKKERMESASIPTDQPYGGTGGNPPETEPKQDEQS